MDLIAGYSLLQIAVALGTSLGAAWVRGLTGFGMAILLVPILALTLPPLEAVLVANFLSLLIGLIELPRLVRGAERTAWTLSGLVILFTPAGLYALVVTSPDVARLLIALIGLSAFVAVLLPPRSPAHPHPATTTGVGIVSGLMTGYAGMPGPPVVPYYVGRSLARERTKTSMMLVFTVAGLAGIGSGAALGVLDWRLAALAAMLFPVVILGNWLGHRASGRISDPVWRTLVGVVLGGAALAALLRLV